MTKFTLVRQRTKFRTRLELMIRKKPSQPWPVARAHQLIVSNYLLKRTSWESASGISNRFRMNPQLASECQEMFKKGSVLPSLLVIVANIYAFLRPCIFDGFL